MLNCLMLSLVVDEITNRHERTKKQDMLIYRDPDKFMFPNLVFLFQPPFSKGLLCVLSCLFRVYRDSQKCGVLNICYRHPQLNYLFTYW